MIDAVTDEKPSTNHSVPDIWVRVCPRCLSTHVDLYLYGLFSQQIFKCIDCEYVGFDFIEVDLPTLENMKKSRELTI